MRRNNSQGSAVAASRGPNDLYVDMEEGVWAGEGGGSAQSPTGRPGSGRDQLPGTGSKRELFASPKGKGWAAGRVMAWAVALLLLLGVGGYAITQPGGLRGPGNLPPSTGGAGEAEVSEPSVSLHHFKNARVVQKEAPQEPGEPGRPSVSNVAPSRKPRQFLRGCGECPARGGALRRNPRSKLLCCPPKATYAALRGGAPQSWRRARLCALSG